MSPIISIMKKLFLIAVMAACVSSMTIGLSSCSKDDPDEFDGYPKYTGGGQGTDPNPGGGEQYFSVSPSQIDFDKYQGGTSYVTVNGAKADDVAISVGDTWVSCKPYSINSLAVTAGSNMSTNPRWTIITITYNGRSQTVKVTQVGKGGGSGGSEGSTSKPAAPTNVRVENYGNVNIPDIRVSWSASSGATSYTVYRSTSANGSYSQIGSTSSTYMVDTRSVSVGNTYYYKVTATNSHGTSGYSSYAVFEFSDTRSPGPVSYGSCSVSGYNMTLRWSLPSERDYGKPTKAILRVMKPSTGDYVNLQTLSPTATSVTFNFANYIDREGYVRAGIILENSRGTGGGLPKIYDTKNKRWMN